MIGLNDLALNEIEKLDTVESVGDPLAEHLGSHGEPAMPTRVVFSEQVTEKRSIECEFHPLEVRPNLNRFELRAWVDENPYYFLRVKILDLPKIPVQMPMFKANFGSRPSALADVFQGGRSGGTGQLWVKTERSWIKVLDTHSIVH